jgi:hypothetical protein
MSNKLFIARPKYAHETDSVVQICTIFQINSQIGTDVRVFKGSQLEVSPHPEGLVTGKHDQGFPWVSSVLGLMLS